MNNLLFKSAVTRRCVAGTALALSFASTAAIAQDIANDVGASERISLAAELGVISVQLTTAACNLNAGIAEDQAKGVIQSGQNRFAQLDEALTFGNPALGIIGEETRTQNLAALAELRGKWEEFKIQVDQVEANANDLEVVEDLARWDGQIRQDAVTLLTEISGSYADSILLLQPDAFRLQLVANVQLGVARISRNSCLLSSGIEKRRLVDELKDRFGLVETALTALREGMESLSVAPPPTVEIQSNLQVISDRWATQRGTIQKVLSREDIDDETQQQLFVALNDISADLEHLAALYVASSKLTY